MIYKIAHACLAALSAVLLVMLMVTICSCSSLKKARSSRSSNVDSSLVKKADVSNQMKAAFAETVVLKDTSKKTATSGWQKETLNLQFLTRGIPIVDSAIWGRLSLEDLRSWDTIIYSHPLLAGVTIIRESGTSSITEDLGVDSSRSTAGSYDINEDANFTEEANLKKEEVEEASNTDRWKFLPGLGLGVGIVLMLVLIISVVRLIQKANNPLS